MIVGVPKEIKRDEYRVAILPVGVEELVRAGHQVLVEAGAGLGLGPDRRPATRAAAPNWSTRPPRSFARADMIVKVKEPLPAEWPLLRAGQIVFTYFHFAADRKLTEAVLASRLHGRRLRNAARRPGPPAAADADERSRRAHEHSGRGQVSRTAADGTRHPAGRRAGRRAGAHHDPRRRRRGGERRQGRRRLRREHRPARHQHGPAALPRRHHAGQRRRAVQRSAHDPRAARAGRPGDRRRADSRAPRRRG